MTTPDTNQTPETDANEVHSSMVLNIMVVRASFARSLELRLRAAEAELAAMRSGEVVAWWCPTCKSERDKSYHRSNEIEHVEGCDTEICGCTYRKCDPAIPLYRSPVPASAVEVMKKYRTILKEGDKPTDRLIGYEEVLEDLDAALSTLTNGAKE